MEWLSIAFEILLILTASIFMIAGIIGCFLPVVPGPPLSYIGLLLMQGTDHAPFSTRFLLIWALITVLVTAMDYAIPIYSTKKTGGSKFGVWGSMLGLIVGLFLGPIGIILGPIVGAIVGELLSGKAYQEALKSGIGSFIGFLLGTLLKLIACCVMASYFISELFAYISQSFS